MNKKTGFVLPSILITTTLVILVGTAVAQLVANNYRLATDDIKRLYSQLAADAGLDYALSELTLDDTWAGSGGEIELQNDQYRSTYDVAVNPGPESDQLLVVSTGRTYSQTDNSLLNQRSYEVLVEGLAPSSGIFSIVTGVGGLFMENSSKILAGDVLINGELTMSGSAQIGLSSAPVRVEVAHQNCPSGGGSSYPEVCSSGQPISIQNPAYIYADVCAKNQTDGSRMSDGGLNSSCSGSSGSAPTPQPLPDHDREAQKAAVVNTISGNYTCSTNNTTQTLAANTRITGNFRVSGSCKVRIEGDVWVGGYLELRNSARLEVTDTVDTGVDGNLPTIMVDGQNGVRFTQLSGVEPNSSGLGIKFITYWSTASCSPDCTDVTGQELYDSREIVTILLRNSSSAEESLLYARWTQAQLDNGGDIGAIVGQTVKLQNSAAVTFGASAGAGGSGTPSVFVIREYRRVF